MIKGLTDAEIQKRIAEGKQNNTAGESKGKSVKQIVLSNIFTFFNFLNVAFFVLILAVGSYKNGLFMIVCILNTVIGIVQELRTKKELDALEIITQPTVAAVRNGKTVKLPIREIVVDDVLRLKTGDQIPTDSEVISGFLEVNESMLTGESDTIVKNVGDKIFSGTFITGGSAYVSVEHVGKENYIETISGEAKKTTKVRSQLKNCVNRILHIVSFIILPLCIGLFCRLYFLGDKTFSEAIVSLVTSGIGMIPEGLVLLTSMSLTLGVLKLAKKRTLVQELYCIENLARVDVVCLDKTGTLTEGKIKVEKAVSNIDKNDFAFAFQQILAAQEGSNATTEGLKNYFGAISMGWDKVFEIPFSSDRKYSGISFSGHGTYYIGAPKFLFPNDTELHETIEPLLEDGLRVIVLAHSDENSTDFNLPKDLKLLGYVAMSDVIRKDCAKTLAYFKQQGVMLKCISGDDPVTVSKIAKKCGLENADRYVDMTEIHTREEMQKAVREYTIFGRVKPEQKKMLVECLQADGHKVAMTGDGVNDVLAMKQSDCSVAMASGSEACKHCANIVLLDSDFSSMPSIVNEGRRVINNITNAASMYLIKTTFSCLLTLGTIILGGTYPFEAMQLSIISGCAVGIPTFFMQFEPSYKKVKDDFMQRVFRNSFPSGLTITIVCLIITKIGNVINGDNPGLMQTICVLCIGWIYFFMLKRIYSPMTTYRRIIAYTMEFVYLVVMIIGQRILTLQSVSLAGVMTLLGVITISPIFIDLFESVYDRWIGKRIQKFAENDGPESNGGAA